MPRHSETKRLPYTARQMYDLVADVGSYPRFLPWNSAARIRSRKPIDGGGEVMEADLVISFKVFRDIPGGCEVSFGVDFEFRNAILQGIIGMVFNDAMQRVVRAFERRAAELYGPPPP